MSDEQIRALELRMYETGQELHRLRGQAEPR